MGYDSPVRETPQLGLAGPSGIHESSELWTPALHVTSSSSLTLLTRPLFYRVKLDWHKRDSGFDQPG